MQAAADEPLQEATIEIGPLMPEKVLVNGIELAADSALRALRRALFMSFQLLEAKANATDVL